MMATPLTRVVSAIIDLLQQCGQSEKAVWLAERLAVLQDGEATSDAREHVASELHAVVLGMGGLMDLSLDPKPGSVHSAGSAREELDGLGDLLYDLTR